MARIRARAEDGVKVRMLYRDPDSAVVAERGQHEGIKDSLAGKIHNSLVVHEDLRSLDTVETRLRSAILYNSIYRADDDLLVNCHIYRVVATQSPVMHQRRVAGGTMVATYLESFERVWSEARPPD